MKQNEKYAVSLGIFAPCADRFVTAGYHKALSLDEMLKQAASVDGMEAIECDYPFMPPAGEDVKKIKSMLDANGVRLCTIEIDHYSDPKWKYGALTSNDQGIRREAIELAKRGIDAARELGTEQINLWLGHDGYDYPFEADYQSYWTRTIDGIGEIAQYCDDVKVCIEYKPKEPRACSLVSNVGKTLLVANSIGLPNVGVNIDIGHALMGFENIADSAVLCHRFGKLFYLHLNDNYRDWDHDMIVGSVHLWETLELLYWLNKIGYDGWYTLDIYPYRQDQVKSAEESIKNLKSLMKIARAMDEAELSGMRQKNDVTGIIRLLREITLPGK